eukprot:342424_1
MQSTTPNPQHNTPTVSVPNLSELLPKSAGHLESRVPLSSVQDVPGSLRENYVRSPRSMQLENRPPSASTVGRGSSTHHVDAYGRDSFFGVSDAGFVREQSSVPVTPNQPANMLPIAAAVDLSSQFQQNDPRFPPLPCPAYPILLPQPCAELPVGALQQLLLTLMGHPEATAFLEPVDWRALELEDYPDIIKNPMDFSTIMKRCGSPSYSSAQFNHDLRLVFANALTYNPPGHWLHVTVNNLISFWGEKLDRALKIQRKRMLQREEKSRKRKRPAPAAPKLKVVKQAKQRPALKSTVFSASMLSKMLAPIRAPPPVSRRHKRRHKDSLDVGDSFRPGDSLLGVHLEGRTDIVGFVKIEDDHWQTSLAEVRILITHPVDHLNFTEFDSSQPSVPLERDWLFQMPYPSTQTVPKEKEKILRARDWIPFVSLVFEPEKRQFDRPANMNRLLNQPRISMEDGIFPSNPLLKPQSARLSKQQVFNAHQELVEFCINGKIPEQHLIQPSVARCPPAPQTRGRPRSTTQRTNASRPSQAKPTVKVTSPGGVNHAPTTVRSVVDQRVTSRAPDTASTSSLDSARSRSDKVPDKNATIDGHKSATNQPAAEKSEQYGHQQIADRPGDTSVS